jgi:hypothetical protein
MLPANDNGDRLQSPPPSSLPSIRELFGIRSGGLFHSTQAYAPHLNLF